jgi:hypothetical protein
MASQRVNTGPRALLEGRSGILRFRSADRDALAKHVFQRYPGREWGTFFRFGYRRTSWGLALSFVDGLWPQPGDMDRQTAITTFRDQYSGRAFHLAAESGLAVGVVHSHPEGYQTFPSRLDDDMDAYFARELAAYSHGAPYCSLILQRGLDGTLTFSGRICDRGEWYALEKMITVGTTIELHHSEMLVGRSANGRHLTSSAESTTARLESLMGARSRMRLEEATVGILGNSGTGTPAGHVLARAGVGGFVLVDPQRFSASNLERLHGSTWDDVQNSEPPFKIEILRRLILSVNPQARVTALVGNVLQENVLDELLRCDVLLGGMDSYHGRAALSDLGQHFLVPSIDMGVLMEGSKGRVSHQLAEFTVVSADHPCAFCDNRIDTVGMAYELMSEEEKANRIQAAEAAVKRGEAPDPYWRRGARQLHTVGYLTTAVGALGAGYVEGWLTGAFAVPHSMFQIDISKEKFGVVAPPRRRRAACSCGMHLGWGDLARSYRNVARPEHWPRRGLLLYRS